MGAFIISYVPNVENVDVIQKVKSVDVVDNVKKVEQVDNVSNVETVQDVMTVHDVRKLPYPHFPLLTYNYQYGGNLHVTNTQNTYQAVFIPPMKCEFKGIHICCTAYNIEDTYDVMIGSRYVMQGSHVKEMSEYRILENYEPVNAGTPIVISFNNNSGTEKYVLYEMVFLMEHDTYTFNGIASWNFNWQNQEQLLNEQDSLSLFVNQPTYVNLDSKIQDFILEVTDLTTQLKVATISFNGANTYSDFVETIPEYMGYGFLARVNVIAITSITRFDNAIQIVFKNINYTGTVDPHPIEIGIKGNANNTINGGI